VCTGDPVIDHMMAEYCEFEWSRQHIDISNASSSKAESLNGIQDKSVLIQAVRNLIPTRPEIGEFSTWKLRIETYWMVHKSLIDINTGWCLF
jgi:hypothetical protein